METNPKIRIFENPEFGKVEVMQREDGKVLFCANDVARALGYKSPKGAVAAHCKTKEFIFKSHQNNLGGTRVRFIDETDVYRLVLKSRLKSADKFKDWVYSEMLPPSEKTISQYKVPTTLPEALKLTADQQIEIEAMRNKIKLFCDGSGIGIKNVANILGLKQFDFVKGLMKMGFIYRNHRGVLRAYPEYSLYIKLFLRVSKLNEYPYLQLMFTCKGFEFIVDLMGLKKNENNQMDIDEPDMGVDTAYSCKLSKIIK